jgi:hypothetical protein
MTIYRYRKSLLYRERIEQELSWTIQSLQLVSEWDYIWFTIVVEGSYCPCMRTLRETMKEMEIKRQEFDTGICNKQMRKFVFLELGSTGGNIDKEIDTRKI